MAAATNQWQRGGASRRLVAALFVVVAGLLSMHGLGSHGVAAGDHMPAAGTGTVATGDHRMTLPAAGGTLADAAAHPVDGGADGEPMSIGALCLAVLSVLAPLLMLASSLRRRQPVPPPPSPRWRVHTVHRRDRDPPSLAQLSVLRR